VLGNGRHGVLVFSFSGAGVGARETRGVLRGVSDWGAAREDDKLKLKDVDQLR
jgi:hypothetical protein